MTTNLHANQQVLTTGTAVAEATTAMVLLHGRGATAASMLPLGGEFQHINGAEKLALVAPQAAGSTWYPYSFLAPREQNEPWLSSALERVDAVATSLEIAGIPRERIVICGFSQGACLATEFVASHPARYAGLIAFTGGLIGEPGSELTHVGDLAGTPALFLSGDPDPHVPWARVEESAQILQKMGAVVQSERFPGRPHTITQEEVQLAQEFLQQALGKAV